MPKGRQILVGFRSASLVDADEIRRTVWRRFVAPLIGAGLIGVALAAPLEAPADPNKALQLNPEPAIEAPAFVRPPRPSPDRLIGPRVRIAGISEGRTPCDCGHGRVLMAAVKLTVASPTCGADERQALEIRA